MDQTSASTRPDAKGQEAQQSAGRPTIGAQMQLMQRILDQNSKSTEQFIGLIRELASNRAQSSATAPEQGAQGQPGDAAGAATDANAGKDGANPAGEQASASSPNAANPNMEEKIKQLQEVVQNVVSETLNKNAMSEEDYARTIENLSNAIASDPVGASNAIEAVMAEGDPEAEFADPEEEGYWDDYSDWNPPHYGQPEQRGPQVGRVGASSRNSTERWSDFMKRQADTARRFRGDAFEAAMSVFDAAYDDPQYGYPDESAQFAPPADQRRPYDNGYPPHAPPANPRSSGPNHAPAQNSRSGPASRAPGRQGPATAPGRQLAPPAQRGQKTPPGNPASRGQQPPHVHPPQRGPRGPSDQSAPRSRPQPPPPPRPTRARYMPDDRYDRRRGPDAYWENGVGDGYDGEFADQDFEPYGPYDQYNARMSSRRPPGRAMNNGNYGWAPPQRPNAPFEYDEYGRPVRRMPPHVAPNQQPREFLNQQRRLMDSRMIGVDASATSRPLKPQAAATPTTAATRKAADSGLEAPSESTKKPKAKSVLTISNSLTLRILQSFNNSKKDEASRKLDKGTTIVESTEVFGTSMDERSNFYQFYSSMAEREARQFSRPGYEESRRTMYPADTTDEQIEQIEKEKTDRLEELLTCAVSQIKSSSVWGGEKQVRCLLGQNTSLVDNRLDGFKRFYLTNPGGDSIDFRDNNSAKQNIDTIRASLTKWTQPDFEGVTVRFQAHERAGAFKVLPGPGNTATAKILG